MALTIKLLGALEINENGTPSNLLQSHKGCALLTFLIITGQPQTREVVADLLFASTSTTQSLHSLRSLLYRVRPFIPFLQTTRNTLSLQPPPDTSIDFYALREALGSPDLIKKKTGLQLYRGDLLTSFYLSDSPRFNEWLAVVRERTRSQVMTTYHELCTDYAEHQKWADGIEIARRWVAVDNLDEGATSWLMRLLAASGQISAALDQYEHFRQHLWQELEVEPEQRILDLAEQLKLQQAAHEPRSFRVAVNPDQVILPEAGVLSEPGALPPHSYFPFHRNVIFSGRSADMMELAELLLPVQNTDGLTKAVVITGMGGMGKTQLAVEYAYRYGRYYPGGVYWINFASEQNVAEEVAAIGTNRGMGLYHPADKLTLAEQASRVQVAWQEARPRLLIFDNCEDELLAADWLPVTGGCSVVITSRRGDWPREMPIREFPLKAMTTDESISLLQQLAGHLSNREAMAITDEVGGLPLALQLAGHYLAHHDDITPQEYLVQLREGSLLQHDSLLGKFIRYSPTGHELSVGRTLAVSFDQLNATDHDDAAALRLLAQITCLAPNEPISLSLLHALEAEIGKQSETDRRRSIGLERLLTLGFLGKVDSESVIMHQLLMLFSRQHLDPELLDNTVHGEVEETLIHQLALHRQTDSSLVTLPFSSAHLRHVTNYALSQERENAASLATLMGEHLTAIAVYDEARSYLSAAVERSEKRFGSTSLQAATAAIQMGSLLQDMGQYKEAEPHYLQALSVHRDILGDNDLDTANSLNKMGTLRLRIGPYPSAAPYLEKAVAIRERLLGPEHPLTLATMNNLGAMHNFMGDPDRARFYFEKVLTVRQETLGPDHLLTATSLNNLGDLLARNGEELAGRPFLEQALAIREKQLGKDHPLTLASKTNLGLLLSQIGESAAARVQLDQALADAISKLGEWHPLTARILNTQGILLTETGRYDEALIRLEKALKIREQVRGSSHPDTAFSLSCIGEVYIALRDEESARPYLELAFAILEQTVEPTAPDFIRVQSQLAGMRTQNIY